MYVVKIMYKEDFSDCFETELCSLNLRICDNGMSPRICEFADLQLRNLKKGIFVHLWYSYSKRVETGRCIFPDGGQIEK
jgi:hypothetical protein